MNVLEILNKLTLERSGLEVFLTNIISAEIKNSNLFLKFPSIKELKDGVIEAFQNKKRFENYFINITFVEKYGEPFLPFTVLNSKYKNFIFYIILNNGEFSSFVIRKDKLLSNKIKRDYLESFQNFYYNDIDKIKTTIEKCFTSMYDRLKNSWKYLHPLIYYNDDSKNLRLDCIVANVLCSLQEEFLDIKRFIGRPFFTFYDLKNYIEKNMEITNES